jgi:hypothetical protein
MLLAAVEGRVDAVRLHGLWGSVRFKKHLPQRLFRAVYENCGDLNSEECRIGSVEAVLPPLLAAPPAAGPSPRLCLKNAWSRRRGYSHFSSPGAAFQPAYHCGSSRRAHANLYAVDSRRLGVYSLELIIQRGFRSLFPQALQRRFSCRFSVFGTACR